MNPEKLNVAPEKTIEVSVQIPAADQDTTRQIELCAFECPGCHTAMGIDVAFIEQVTESLSCHHCGTLLRLDE